MVRGQYKSHSFRRVSRRTPGGRVSHQYKLRKPGKAHCADCGCPLSGVANERPRKMQNMPKSKKRPSRLFGGVLCSKCMRKQLLTKVLSSN
jgi:large subunit ribosomal protein L34e